MSPLGRARAAGSPSAAAPQTVAAALPAKVERAHAAVPATGELPQPVAAAAPVAGRSKVDPGCAPAAAVEIPQACGPLRAEVALGEAAPQALPEQPAEPASAADAHLAPLADPVGASGAGLPVVAFLPQVPSSPPALSPSVTPALREVEPPLPREPHRAHPTPQIAPPSEALASVVRPPRLAAAEPMAPMLPFPAAPGMAASAPRIPAPSPAPALPLPFRSPDGLVEPRHVRLILRTTLALLLAIGGLLLALIILYRWVDPPASTLMLAQRFAGTPIRQRWIPLERMSPNLVAAVIASEDGHFCRHHGVDWGELREAIESAGDGLARGGSTISMQVVKNLFLWPSRSYVRKAIEIALAYAIEALWGKRRILEIYLNIAEWGPGIFGAEAAARYHFRKPALLLNPHEAALLAVSLPNPFERQAGRPGPGTLRLADNLMLRMKAAQANTGCGRVAALPSAARR